MAKIRKVEISSNGEVHLLYNCLGCGYEHAFCPKVHSFNGDMDKPTVSPSLLHSGNLTCHSFIKEGRIQYLNDCHHAMAGFTVELPEYGLETGN